MQTNADYNTPVTGMSVYYIQYEKKNKSMCYNSGWLWKVCAYCKYLHYIYVYIMQTNNGYHYVSKSENVTHI